MAYTRKYNYDAVCEDCQTQRSIDGDVVVDYFDVRNGTDSQMYLCLGDVARRRWNGQTVKRLADPSPDIYVKPAYDVEA